MAFTTLLVDLDDTVYPSSSGLWTVIRERIGLYMIERMGMPAEIVPPLRMRLFNTYGTTLRGLKMEYKIDENDFLAFVHDVPLKNYIAPDPSVRHVLQHYPLRKAIFTNADDKHAQRVLSVLDLSDCFEQIIDIRILSPHCKPQPEAYTIALNRLNEAPENCIMIDDSISNLLTAREMGIFTILLAPAPDNEAHAWIEHLKDLSRVLDSVLLN